jgi:hypothetical protein
MADELFNNSGQAIKTAITKSSDSTSYFNAGTDFTAATYIIYDKLCTTKWVEKTLLAGGIAVIADVDAAGNVISVFETTVLAADMNMPAGEYIHQFRVVNNAGLALPPIFETELTIVNVCVV